MTEPILTRLVNAAFPFLNARSASEWRPGRMTPEQFAELCAAINAAKAWLAKHPPS